MPVQPEGVIGVAERGEFTDEKSVETTIASLLEQAGLHLLDFSASRHAGGVRVKAVVYAPGGTGTDECAKAHRLILPQIQLGYGVQKVDIEVSSPGIDRIIRSEREWKAFVGKGIRILARDSDDWFSGTLETYESGQIRIKCKEGVRALEISSVAKARLDSSYKGD